MRAAEEFRHHAARTRAHHRHITRTLSFHAHRRLLLFTLRYLVELAKRMPYALTPRSEQDTMLSRVVRVSTYPSFRLSSSGSWSSTTCCTRLEIPFAPIPDREKAQHYQFKQQRWQGVRQAKKPTNLKLRMDYRSHEQRDHEQTRIEPTNDVRPNVEPPQ